MNADQHIFRFCAQYDIKDEMKPGCTRVPSEENDVVTCTCDTNHCNTHSAEMMDNFKLPVSYVFSKASQCVSKFTVILVVMATQHLV